MNIILSHKKRCLDAKKDAQTQEQICFIDLKIGCVKSVKLKKKQKESKQVIIAEIITS